jgi:DNA-binding response OmpR family regulator
VARKRRFIDSAGGGSHLDLTVTAKRILLVEQLAETAALWKKYFSMAGFDVTICHSVVAAVDVLLNQAAYDVVLSEQDLPDDSGLVLLERLRELHPQTPFVMVMGRRDPATVDRVRAAGNALVVDKPFAFMELLNAVKSVCTKRPGA